MCIAMNGDQLRPGQYAVSTSNRNFEGRQGKGGRTFLASPLTAAATAIAGVVADPRRAARASRRWPRVGRSLTMAEPFRVFTSAVIPLPAENVDTDQIVPARYLKVTDKDGLARRAVPRLAVRGGRLAQGAALRARPAGDGRPADPARRRQLRRRLVARARAVGARPRGASGRSCRPRSPTSSGTTPSRTALLPIVVEADDAPPAVRALAGEPDAELTVDLEEQGVLLPGDEDLPFDIDPFARMMLLAGTDELGYLLGKEPEIEAWEAAHPPRVDTLGRGRLSPESTGTEPRAASSRLAGMPSQRPTRPSAPGRDRRPGRSPPRATPSAGRTAPRPRRRPRRRPVPRARRASATDPTDGAGGGVAGNPGSGNASDLPLPVDPTPVDPGAGQPALVVPEPGRQNPHPVAPTLLQASVDGRHVLVKISWYGGVAPCSVLDSVHVDKGQETIALTVIEGSSDLTADLPGSRDAQGDDRRPRRARPGALDDHRTRQRRRADPADDRVARRARTRPSPTPGSRPAAIRARARRRASAILLRGEPVRPPRRGPRRPRRLHRLHVRRPPPDRRPARGLRRRRLRDRPAALARAPRRWPDAADPGGRRARRDARSSSRSARRSARPSAGWRRSVSRAARSGPSTGRSAGFVGAAQALLVVWLVGGLLAAGRCGPSRPRRRPRSSSAA